jgi:AcrR family transcriptional regulator
MARRSRSANGEPSLTRERIVEAALRLAETEADLDRVTVRRLAADLGVGAMTLYSYFRSKDDILDAMADQLLGRMALPAGPDAGPAEALRTVGHAFLEIMRDNPTVLRLLTTRVTDSRTALRGAMEAVLQRLVDAGIPGPVAVRCYGFLIAYAIGFASYQRPRQWGRRLSNGSEAELRRQRRHFYAGLPLADFPQIVNHADEVAKMASDGQFEAGLSAFIDATVQALSNAGSAPDASNDGRVRGSAARRTAAGRRSARP